MVIRGAVVAALLAGLGALSGPANATTETVNYQATAAGTPILIGASASPQYSFFSGAYLGFFSNSDFIVGNDGATIAFPYDGVVQPQIHQLATSLSDIRSTDGAYALNFDIGSVAYTGLATLSDNGTVITQISYDPVTSPTGVPEPSAWALLLLGVASLGLALRSRTRLAIARA